MTFIFIIVLFSLLHQSKEYVPNKSNPEQIHLSLGTVPTEIMVTWVTQVDTNSSIVEFGLKDLNRIAKGYAETFIDGGPAKRTFSIHRVLLSELIPGISYTYHCGCPELGWSSLFHFTTLKGGVNWSPNMILIGDMGNENAKSLPYLQEEAQKGTIDLLLHVGDFAYDMDTNDAKVGDLFMNQIQAIAAYIPYMTCPGNHEQAYNFSNYKNRFSMPNDQGKNMFYSFDVGPAHIISYNSEYYYYVKYGWMQIVNQYQWLEQDLIKANLPENRKKTPWIITMSHRPFYCSNSVDIEHCNIVENIIRSGLPMNHEYSLENLFYKYGVDLSFQAHEHSYERTWPVFNRTVCNGSSDAYVNPQAPVYIVTGSAGNKEGETPFLRFPYKWSAFHADDYGYTKMKIVNSSHLYLEQISVDQGGKVIDKMLLIKDRIFPKFNCHLKNKF